MRGRNLYVVINAHRVRILRGLPAANEAPGPELILNSGGSHLRDIIGGAADRARSSCGERASENVDHTADPMAQDQRRFLHRVFDLLEEEKAHGGIAGIYVFASDDMMRLWRRDLPAGLRPLVRREVVQNLVRLPSRGLAARIRDSIATHP